MYEMKYFFNLLKKKKYNNNLIDGLKVIKAICAIRKSIKQKKTVDIK